MAKPKSIFDSVLGFVSNPRKVLDMADTINDSYKLMMNTKDIYSEMKKNPEDFLKKAASSVLDSTTRIVERKIGEKRDVEKRDGEKSKKEPSQSGKPKSKKW